MMMSREDEEQRQHSLAVNASTDDYGHLDDDLEHLDLEEEEEDEQDDGISDVVSRASSYGLGSSRASTSNANNTEWRPKSFEHTNSLPASPYMRPSLSPPTTGARTYSKIQVSPRLNPHLYASPRSPSPVPDMIEVSDWPLPSPVNSVPSPITINGNPASPSPIGSFSNKWSAVASAGGHATNAMPRSPVRGGASSSPSLLTSQIRGGQQSTAPSRPVGATHNTEEEDMDEELRFVLELSRAEEESRQAAAREAALSS